MLLVVARDANTRKELSLCVELLQGRAPAANAVELPVAVWRGDPRIPPLPYLTFDDEEFVEASDAPLSATNVRIVTSASHGAWTLCWLAGAPGRAERRRECRRAVLASLAASWRSPDMASAFIPVFAPSDSMRALEHADLLGSYGSLVAETSLHLGSSAASRVVLEELALR